MMEEIACAIVVGAITHQSVIVHAIGKRISKIERKLNCVESNLEKHESRSLPPVLAIPLIACFFMAACSPWRVPAAPALPHAPELPHAAPAPSAGHAATDPAPKASPGDRLERASYTWGAWGIGAAVLGLLSAIGLYIYIPALRSMWIKQGAVALAMLACAITVWTLAPGMLYLFWSVSILSILSIVGGIVYMLRQAHKDDTALIRKA